MNVSDWIPGQHRLVRGHPCEKVLQRCRGREGTASAEVDAALCISERAAVETVAVYLDAELQCMDAARVRNVVHKLETRIGSLQFRPLESAQCLELAEKPDSRQSAGKRCGNNAGVKSVSRVRIHVVIAVVGGLVEPVVPEAGLIHPVRGRDPDPT